MEFYQAILLGIVEGLTEFLPISSTAHLLMTGRLLGVDENDTLFKNFAIVIQLGSILAILVLFWHRFCSGMTFYLKLAVAFFPTGVLGLIFSDYIQSLLSPHIAAYMLIIGGMIFILIEYKNTAKQYPINDLKSISFKHAFCIGCFQSLAMIPGVSRSGATIIGGLLLGLNRQVATEFSFLLAFPTMIIASGYSMVKHHGIITTDYIEILLVGMGISFLSALIAMKAFLSFVSHFSFTSFGIYRICIGIAFLLFFS